MPQRMMLTIGCINTKENYAIDKLLLYSFYQKVVCCLDICGKNTNQLRRLCDLSVFKGEQSENVAAFSRKLCSGGNTALQSPTFTIVETLLRGRRVL
jgi:hypothetical protein